MDLPAMVPVSFNTSTMTGPIFLARFSLPVMLFVDFCTPLKEEGLLMETQVMVMMIVECVLMNSRCLLWCQRESERFK